MWNVRFSIYDAQYLVENLRPKRFEMQHKIGQ